MFVISGWRVAEDAANPARTFLVMLAVVLPNYVLIMSVLTANILQPPRFDATGFRACAGNPLRYDVYARWEQIDRIWLNPANVLFIRLRDPEASARGGRRLRGLMRRNRRGYGADLLLNLSLQAPELEMADVREAVARLSGGTHLVERSAADGGRIIVENTGPLINFDDVGGCAVRIYIDEDHVASGR
ncbi:hypothetical protein ACIA8K_05815 [Catenuloplanes sp. NPDC051500]|uniref:hypothetical protein n=1 Tax=Catenuloplanes sp. NPDC051500 TaxID=3363959 RepID=UPI0037BA2B41